MLATNDNAVPVGNGDTLELISTRDEREIHNFNYTRIAEKLRELQSAWQQLTVGSSIAYDVSLGVNAKLATPGAGNVIAAITNVVDGMTGSLLIQGGANSPGWDASWDFGSAGVPKLTNNTAKMDVISWVQKGNKTIAAFVQGFDNA